MNDLKSNSDRNWSLEYTTVMAITVLFAARKIFIAPAMSWLEVVSPIIGYYLIIFVLSLIKTALDGTIEYLSNRKSRDKQDK